MNWIPPGGPGQYKRLIASPTDISELPQPAVAETIAGAVEQINIVMMTDANGVID